MPPVRMQDSHKHRTYVAIFFCVYAPIRPAGAASLTPLAACSQVPEPGGCEWLPRQSVAHQGSALPPTPSGQAERLAAARGFRRTAARHLGTCHARTGRAEGEHVGEMLLAHEAPGEGWPRHTQNGLMESDRPADSTRTWTHCCLHPAQPVCMHSLDQQYTCSRVPQQECGEHAGMQGPP